jgi:cyclic pyranopterin phosphate synthase
MTSRIIDVADKAATDRTAQAEAMLSTTAEVVRRVIEGGVTKGDVLRTAEVAGLYAMKRTSDLLPMCHPLPLAAADVQAVVDGPTTLRVTAFARTFDRTGVEMEALTAVSVAALTLYDMLKKYDPAIVVGPIRLLEKTGGKSGRWLSPDLVERVKSGPFEGEAVDKTGTASVE